jgi:hypothetical protein
MIRPPYAARVAAGVVVTVLEETRKLPTTAITLPMTAVSQTLQTIMRFQQQIAEMAIKGDDVFESLLGHNEEEPEWATFDEDDDTPAPAATPDSGPDPEVVDGNSSAPSGSGRFALYSSAPDIDAAAATATAATDGDAPEIVELLDYDDLTLAQLRAKLKTVGLPELQDLAAYERSHRARAPFLTMLDNRVTAASK